MHKNQPNWSTVKSRKLFLRLNHVKVLVCITCCWSILSTNEGEIMSSKYLFPYFTANEGEEVLKVIHSCPLFLSSWLKHPIFIIFSGCNECTKNTGSLKLWERRWLSIPGAGNCLQWSRERVLLWRDTMSVMIFSPLPSSSYAHEFPRKYKVFS